MSKKGDIIKIPIEKDDKSSVLKVDARENEKNLDTLYEALKLKSIFIADVSHELRTSLTIMQCSMDLLLKDADFKKENLQLCQNVTTEIKRISALFSDLTSLTKENLVSMKAHYKKVDLNQIIFGICEELQILADKKHIKILYSKKEKPIEIVAHKDSIEKIFLNLIKNSIAYNTIGGWVHIDLKQTKKGVYAYIKDNGIGISATDLPYIFERFYRSNKIKIQKNKGSGLGLAISKSVIENHEGKISVKSKLKKGTTFTLFFPHSNKIIKK